MSRAASRRSLHAAVCVVFIAFVWCPAWARGEAELARVALEWRAPAAAGCATQEQLHAELARLTEREPAERGPIFRIQALAVVHDGYWAASVALFDDRGHLLGGREVTGSYVSCRELDIPVALVVATLLDGLREPPTPARAPAARAPDPRAGRLGIGAFLAGALGLVPHVAAGAGARVELPLAWPVAIDASVYLPGEELDAAGRGARSVSFHAGAALCPRLVGQRHALRLCGGVQAGAVVTKGVELTESRRATRPLVLIGLEPKLLLGLTEIWTLQLSAAAYWIPVRPRFHWEIDGSGGHSTGAEGFALVARIGITSFLR